MKAKSIKPRVYKKKRLIKKKPVVPQAVKSYVNKMISVNEEDKSQSYSNLTTLLTYNAVGNTLRTLDFNSVISLISQGAGAGQRIGNKIKVQSLSIRGWLSVGSTFTSAPVVVKMFVGRLKQSVNTTDGTYANLYQAGNGILPPQNTYFDILRLVNKDIYTVYNVKTFKLGLASLGASTSNNDFKMLIPFYVNINKHIANLTFNDSTPTPSNFGCYVWFTCVLADGTATPATVPLLVNCCYDMEIAYQDA